MAAAASAVVTLKPPIDARVGCATDLGRGSALWTAHTDVHDNSRTACIYCLGSTTSVAGKDGRALEKQKLNKENTIRLTHWRRANAFISDLFVWVMADEIYSMFPIHSRWVPGDIGPNAEMRLHVVCPGCST